jgi:hypothetical protein
MNKHFDEIEDYLFGDLSENKKTELETAMLQDPATARAVEQQRTEHEAMRLLRQEALRAQMRTWTAGGATQATAAAAPDVPMTAVRGGAWNRLRLFQMAIAACFVLVAAWFLLRPDSVNTAQLAMNHYPALPENLRAADAPADPLDDALALLRQNDPHALSLLQQIPATHSKYSLMPLLEAHYYFYQKDYASAIARCQSVLDNPASAADLRQEAEWCLALAALAKEGKEGALFKRTMASIQAAGATHLRAKKAADLLQSLQ